MGAILWQEEDAKNRTNFSQEMICQHHKIINTMLRDLDYSLGC